MLLTSVKPDVPEALHAHVRLYFPKGLVGLEHWKEFRLMVDSEPIMLLVPEEDPDRLLPVTMVALLVNGYEIELSDADVETLELRDPSDAVVLAILTVRRDPPTVTANLLAPLVINRRNLKGLQVILDGSGYPLRHVVFSAKAGS